MRLGSGASSLAAERADEATQAGAGTELSPRSVLGGFETVASATSSTTGYEMTRIGSPANHASMSWTASVK